MILEKLVTHMRSTNAPCTLKHMNIRFLSVGVLRTQEAQSKPNTPKHVPRASDEWRNAKDFKSMPGPSRIQMIRDFLPGGELHNLNFVEFNRVLRKRYGDIYRIKGMMGKPDSLYTYNPADFEVTYRTEGLWPLRMTLQSIIHYRKVKRADLFKGISGLVTEQGESWANMRNKVNPIMMKVQNVRLNLPQIDEIALDFMKRIDAIRDPTTNLLNNDFQTEVKMWGFESLSYITLNTRMGVIDGKGNEEALEIAKYMTDFLQYSFEYDIVPSYWKYFETPGFKHLMKAHDNLTEITVKYIDAAMKRFEEEKRVEAKSALEKLCRIDRGVAIVMGIDMMLGGMDTTSAAFLTALFYIAKHPATQERIRQELKAVMPNPNVPITEENTKNMPYLRACFKESARLTPVVPINSRLTGQDMVLSGYRVPKGIGVQMNNMELCLSEDNFPRSREFIPERWLKVKEYDHLRAKSLNPFIYLPFGFGPRTCIGKRVAEMEMETLMTRLLRKYRVSWEGAEDMKFTSNLIMIPYGKMNFKFETIANENVLY